MKRRHSRTQSSWHWHMTRGIHAKSRRATLPAVEIRHTLSTSLLSTDYATRVVCRMTTGTLGQPA